MRLDLQLFFPFPRADSDTSSYIARDLTLEAAQSASSSRSLRSTETSRVPSSAQIKKLLDSRNDREILDGLRKVISVRNRVYTASEGVLLVLTSSYSVDVPV